MKIWKLKFNVEEYDSLVPVKYSLDKFQIFDGKKKKVKMCIRDRHDTCLIEGRKIILPYYSDELL